jgi:hypothetical protein
VLPHPLYSSDLAPSDFHVFPKLKEHLKDQRFSYDEELKSAGKNGFKNKQPVVLRTDFRN